MLAYDVRFIEWTNFSATAGLGVMCKGHYGINLVQGVVYHNMVGDCPYSDGGALYAFGQMIGNNDKSFKDKLLSHMKYINYKVLFLRNSEFPHTWLPHICLYYRWQARWVGWKWVKTLFSMVVRNGLV